MCLDLSQFMRGLRSRILAMTSLRLTLPWESISRPNLPCLRMAARVLPIFSTS